MNQQKIIAAIIALCLVSGGFVLVCADDSEAATAGSMNVYIYDGSEWSCHLNEPGYNALQALQATEVTFEADTDYILEKENEYGPYLEINDNYGNVTSIGDVKEEGSNVWNVFVYNNANNSWSVGIDAIGFITPFSDGVAPSANVVFYYGADAESVPNDVTNYMSDKPLASLIDPSETDDFRYTFTISISESASGYTPTVSPVEAIAIDENGNESSIILTSSIVSEGVTLVGYGSNAYAALKDAVGVSNISAIETAGAYYGWIDTLFGLGTVSSGSNYVYWSQTGEDYLAFNLGAYSIIDGVPSDTGSSDENFNQNEFWLEYTGY